MVKLEKHLVSGCFVLFASKVHKFTHVHTPFELLTKLFFSTMLTDMRGCNFIMLNTKKYMNHEINKMYPLLEAEMGPAVPSCTGYLCPAEACHTEPLHRSAWAGNHQHRTSSLEGSRQRAESQVRAGQREGQPTNLI